MPRLRPQDIHVKDFKRAVRGFDIDEVNEFLDLIIQDYSEYEDLLSKKSKTSDITTIHHLLEQLAFDMQQLREENQLLRTQVEQLGQNFKGLNSKYYR
ncbi:DivIVA domain-containing protein [Hazenella sp. IB182357]|uniref:DivIVA domain-containing protein n=1 Tax=Polycladospora coralii TaxID=2771432 RepID=A0A926NGL0_9BACL|nr:DivIVA domain-containing protein [Polycladospora coralii]MBS7530867.1 DivIVA domain-containing protein [Polycladospora coralii]